MTARSGANRRKLAETRFGPRSGAKAFSGARISPRGLLSSRAQRETFTAASTAPPFGFAQGRRCARGGSPFSDRHAHGCVMPSPRRAVGDWQDACGNCGNSRDASRQGFVSALGNLQVDKSASGSGNCGNWPTGLRPVRPQATVLDRGRGRTYFAAPQKRP